MTRWVCMAAVICQVATVSAVDISSGRLVAETPLRDEQLIAAPLPAALFASADAALGNVWVEDDSGARVPAVIEPLTRSAERRAHEPCVARRTRATLSDDGTALELDFDLAHDAPPPTGMTIQTPLRDFRRRVRVATSADGATWQTRVDDALIYALERFVDVRQCDVRWTAAPEDRHVRVIFLDADADRIDTARRVTVTSAGQSTTQTVVRAEPLAVKRIDFWREWIQQVPGETVLTEYPIHVRDVGVKEGWQVLDLAAGSVPLSRLTLRTDDSLFSRPYTLHGLAPRQGGGGGVTESSLAQGTLSQVAFQGVGFTNLMVTFATQRFEVYRLRLGAANGATSAVTIARAEGPAWQAVVPMRPERRYTLHCGGDAPLPSMDGRAVVTALRAAGAVVAPGRIDHYAKTRARGAPLIGKTHLLFLTMLTTGGILLWTLLRKAKQMR